MSPQAHFTPEFFRFFRELKAHNDRAWFNANKGRYEAAVRDPMLRFIADFAAPLSRISRRFLADARASGGSMFRIYRDVRFSKDKSPYKTHAAASFHHEASGRVHAPGFYLHIGPGEVYAGGGIWHPEPDVLARVREAVVARPAEWKRARKGLELDGERLKRPPAGFDPAHPLIEDLKFKDFIAGAEFSEKEACSPAFTGKIAAAFKEIAPLVKFLCGALRIPY
jgi:uncharacterized protein (TIGR02453 family)